MTAATFLVVAVIAAALRWTPVSGTLALAEVY
jgi:uncharacterized membrane protein YtjA (UPF0391 family)